MPQSFVVADYNPDQAWERFRAEANVAKKDTTTYGQPYVYGTHHLDQASAQWEVQLRHEAAIAWQIVYEGESNVLALQPARILRMDADLPDAPNGQVIIEVTHRGERDEPYSNTYRAIPSDRRFRLKLDEDRWPKITGTLSARVTSPSNYEYAVPDASRAITRCASIWTSINGIRVARVCRCGSRSPLRANCKRDFTSRRWTVTKRWCEFSDGDLDKPYISAFPPP